MKNQKKIKMLFLVNDFLVGGVQKLVIDQVSLLPRSDFELVVVSLIQFEGKGTFYDRIPPDVKLYKLEFKGVASIKEWLKLIRIIWREKPDIVKSALFFSNMIARILKPFFGYKVVAAEHNTEGQRKLRYIVMNWLLAPLCSTIIADSKTVADFVSRTEHISPERFTVIYNGVELEAIASAEKELENKRDAIRTEIGVKTDSLMFLNVARLNTQKNHALMVEAFNQFIKNGNEGTLVIVGGGSLREMLEEKIRKYGLQDRVILLGERRDVYRYYSVADVFLLTSLREGFCISAMDALAFGKPVISTKVAGLIEYIVDGENGFLVDDNATAIATALGKFARLSLGERKKLSEQARKTAQGFSVEAYINTHRDLYLKFFS